jgi:CRISPR-associated protein Cas2
MSAVTRRHTTRNTQHANTQTRNTQHANTPLLTMRCLLIYDIPDDSKRTKIADACLDYGLDRVQYSAFIGDISRNHQEELFQKVRRILGKKAGNIRLIPICATDWGHQLLHEKE